jgi:hypothetical protein
MHLTALAQAMKAAGITGITDTLRAHAYLHLLTGHPIAHACAPRSPPPPAHPGTPPGPGPRAGTPATGPPDWLRSLFTTHQTRDCTHPRESRGYQPSRTLRHLIEIPQPRLHRARLPPRRHPLRPGTT